MQDNTQIKTTLTVNPQIYAYIIPNFPPKEGWVKIGETFRQSVEERIKQQLGTADIPHILLWAKPARLIHNNQVFRDHDLHRYLKKFKGIEKNKEWFYYNGTPEQSEKDFYDFIGQQFKPNHQQTNEYELRSEQKRAVEQTLAFFQAYPGSEFLWNAKPRFGKTLTTYHLARELNAEKVLIVTNRPAIAHSWYDDFEQFIAWQTNFAFVSTSETLKNRPVLSREAFLTQRPDGKKNMLAFISLQDLKGAIAFGGQFDKLAWVKDMIWDLLVIDEAHEGVDTRKTETAFDNIQRKHTLHLSGTPFKAVAAGTFKEDEIFNWSYADEQTAKANWTGEENNPYETLPRLNLFSYQISAMLTETINQGAQIDGKNHDYAFDLNEFFSTNEKGKFIYEKDVKKWLDTLSHNEKYPFSTHELRQELKHTFWLLNRVASAKALQKLLEKHPVFEHYKIILAAGDGTHDNDDNPIANQNALTRVREAISKHERTITLSVGQLTTGVTIPEWTAVLMLSNLKSPALYMQAAFRAQNPWQFEQNGEIQQKQNAYVFDFAPERTLQIYDDFANDLFSKTAGGKGTTETRQHNIKELLNFFPVIAEDNLGKMVELDVNQVLTIPKVIKAQEVVRRGFMSNLLFQNISGIFASAEAREILEQLNPIAEGKNVPNTNSSTIDTQNVNVDEDGNAFVSHEIVIAETTARFGEKIYQNIVDNTQTALNEHVSGSLKATEIAAQVFKQHAAETINSLTTENNLPERVAEQVIKQSTQIIAYEVEKIQAQSDIQRNEAELIYKKAIQTAQNDIQAQAQAKTDLETKQRQIAQTEQAQILTTIAEKSQELTQTAVQTVLTRAEEVKQNTVEDDIRARLRGFSRTIPSFLMAYGTAETTLANFDHILEDDVFQEVTGITLEQFRLLRDKHCFFDEVVFNQSVQEFLTKRKTLANYFDNTNEEDIFDYIPPQKTNQIFTPKKVVNLMLDKMLAENPNLFKNKNTTFVDLYMKSGLYLTEIVKRLYVGLANEIPDNQTRLRHILENQVYGFAPSKIIYHIAKNFILGFDEQAAQINPKNIVCLDITSYAMGKLDFDKKLQELFGKTMRFDVVVGNPPYQENASGDSTKGDPIYHHFYNLAEQISPIYCLISPARFLFNAGGTDKQWNAKMLNDEYLKVVYFNQKSAELFPNTDIKGGVAVIYRNKYQKTAPIGIFTSFEELNSIIHKVESKLIEFKKETETLDTIISGRGIYRFTPKMHEDFPNVKNILSVGHQNDVGTSALTTLHNILFFEEKPDDGLEYVKVLGRYQNERVFHFIRKAYINKPFAFDKYKIILPKANGSGAIGEVLSTPLIGTPLIGFTETFISIGAFDTLAEAENCLKYVKSKFARTMLGVLKITQDNTKEKWAKVPLQDFTEQSDIDWTQSITDIDRQLYHKYGLDEHEIAFIEEKVRAME